MSFEIRNFLPQQFELVRDWTQKQQWNPGVNDYIAFRQIDKNGFWMGTLDGQAIGALGAAQYDQNFAFVGWYIVRPQYRKKGYGIQLWEKALSRITAKNIALQGVLQQEPNYVKSGFKTYHKTIRHQLYGTNVPFDSPNLIDCQKLDIQRLSKYDRNNFPSQRKAFLKKWIHLPESKSIAYVKQDEILGYGVLRKSADGYRIGPLFAENFDISVQILKNLIGVVKKDEKIYIDIPDINKNALLLAEQFKMKGGFTCARMYTNGPPEIQVQKTVYGVTSLQFG